MAGGEDDDVDLDSVAGELYGLPPDEFTTARDARAAEARSAGDRELAGAIKKLRRPTAGAWLANQLVRERQDQLAELLDLGEEMRQAQSELAGNELRRLAQDRRQVVNALIEEARNVGRERGRPVSDASAREVESTLEAALADPGAADALWQGRLVTALQYSGFGPGDLTGWAPASSGPATGPPQSATAPPESATAPPESATAGPGMSSARSGPTVARSGPAVARSGPAAARSGSAAAATRRERSQERRSRELIQSAQRELRAAEAAAARAEREAANHERRVRGAQSERDRVYSQVADLERRLRDARAAGEQALRDLQDAEEAQETADREVRSAKDRIARARTELERLTPPGV